ncbi:MAG TPA: L-aspartate oxidase [Vicinamibacteria bacterium]|nr:L-aspartate oxidase [Vicinamibacteria bacterium]
MSRRLDAVRDAEVVVVGAGAAGLSVALGLAGRRVDLLAKGPLRLTGNSPLAQGGVAAAVAADDSPRLHAADTLAVGGEIADPAAVAALTGDGPRRMAELVALGARFDLGQDGSLDLAREAAHSRARVLHARDATGAELVRALRTALRGRGGLGVFERALALELLLDGGRVTGLLARHEDGALVLHRARAVVLATGGIGRLFARTTNPAEATGDGLALAWRAGARLVDLEMVQFHPTALDLSGNDPMPLLTEALRGAGARLVDADGEALLEGPRAELQARDVVARGIHRAFACGRSTFLDAREAVGDAFPERFPTVFEACAAHGIDPRRRPIPVAPAAHYHMGGIATDGEGRTSLAGLWAAGEAACTGVHGANRLASNSLLEALVFGARAARSVGEALPHLPRPAASPSLPSVATASEDPAAALSLLGRLRQLMWDEVGLVRTAEGLRRAMAELHAMGVDIPSSAGELRSLHTVATLLATAALARPESRGAHFRADHPTTDPAWRQRIVLRRSHDGVALSTWPAPDASRPAAEAWA